MAPKKSVSFCLRNCATNAVFTAIAAGMTSIIGCQPVPGIDVKTAAGKQP
jgi:hypothetical protein